MSPPDHAGTMQTSRRVRKSLAHQTSAHWFRYLVLACALVVGGLSAPPSALAWGRKVRLVRKYRPGHKMVYETKLHTKANIQSEPPGLKDLLPPVPTEFSLKQQNTVTVETVRPDGSADLQNRFDEVEVQSNLPARMPQSVQDSAVQAQQEFSRRVAGQVLTAHYDHEGRLMKFEGDDAMLQQLDVPLREPVRQVLRLFLEQLGGNSLYPDHPVKPGDEWEQKLTAPPSEDHPFRMDGTSTLRYIGNTRYRGVKAAIVDFHFQNALTPALEGLRQAGPLAQLEAHGLGLDIRIEGHGQGRVLLALDDGRVLQNHATIQQTLNARLKNSGNLPLPTSQPVHLEIQSQTEMDVEGSGK